MRPTIHSPKALLRLVSPLLIALVFSNAHGEPLDLARSVKNAVSKGASAEQILQILDGYGVDPADAIVIAIHNAPDEMAGDLARVAVDRAPAEEKRNIGYLALSASKEDGTCQVASVINVPPPSTCGTTRYTFKDYRSYNAIQGSEFGGGSIGGGGSGGVIASPGLM